MVGESEAVEKLHLPGSVGVVESRVSIVSLLEFFELWVALELDWLSVALFELSNFGSSVGGEIIETLLRCQTPADPYGYILIVSRSGVSKSACISAGSMFGLVLPFSTSSLQVISVATVESVIIMFISYYTCEISGY